jgi:hypothetical protein
MYEMSDARSPQHRVDELHIFLGGRAFFLLFFSGECRERDGMQSNDRLQKDIDERERPSGPNIGIQHRG